MTDLPKNDPRTSPASGLVPVPSPSASIPGAASSPETSSGTAPGAPPGTASGGKPASETPAVPKAGVISTPEPGKTVASGLATASGASTGKPAGGSTGPSATIRHINEVRPPPGGPRVWPRVAGVLILLAGAGGAFLWQNPDLAHRLLPSAATPPASPPASPDGREAAEARIRTLESRLAQLEQRPAPTDPVPALSGRLSALEKLAGRVDALEQRPETAPPPPSPAAPAFDPQPLHTRLDALEARAAMPLVAASAVDLRPYIARIEALEQRVTRPAADPGKLAALAARVDELAARDITADMRARLETLAQTVAKLAGDPEKLAALSGRLDALAARDPAADLRGRLDALEKQLTGVAATAGRVNEVSDRVARVDRMRAAMVALSAGQKLGSIPGAPPALMRFANTPPPTETSLRLDFPAAERAALEVSVPDMKGKPLVDRMLARLQDYNLVTVRQGDEVLVGNTTAETLSRAHGLLNAGDLAGAVKAVSTLTGESARAMAPWLDSARALLLAREALTTLAGNG